MNTQQGTPNIEGLFELPFDIRNSLLGVRYSNHFIGVPAKGTPFVVKI